MPSSSKLSEEWKPYTNDEKRYLHIGGLPDEQPTTVKLIEGDMPFHDRMAFWDDVLFPRKAELPDLDYEVDVLFDDDDVSVEVVKDEL